MRRLEPIVLGLERSLKPVVIVGTRRLLPLPPTYSACPRAQG